ncbi:MAG: prolipoprotein diacylglyceryl transferase family protein [Candidatus Shapirobacteria bacterium]
MILGIIKVLGILLFAYLIWRNLRENYKDEELTSYAWIALLAFFIGGRLVFGLIHWGIWNNNWLDWLTPWSKPGMSYLGAYLSVFGTTWILCKIRDWKIWAFAEDSLMVFLIFFGFLFLDEFIRSKFNLITGLYGAIILVTLVFSSIIRNKYRSFVWYKSGKKGFTFFFANAIVCLMLAIMSFYFKINLVYSILYSVGVLVSLVGLFILGEIYEK